MKKRCQLPSAAYCLCLHKAARWCGCGEKAPQRICALGRTPSASLPSAPGQRRRCSGKTAPGSGGFPGGRLCRRTGRRGPAGRPGGAAASDERLKYGKPGYFPGFFNGAQSENQLKNKKKRKKSKKVILLSMTYISLAFCSSFVYNVHRWHLKPNFGKRGNHEHFDPNQRRIDEI